MGKITHPPVIHYHNVNKPKNRRRILLDKDLTVHAEMRKLKNENQSFKENIWKIVRKYLEIWKGMSELNPVIMMGLTR